MLSICTCKHWQLFAHFFCKDNAVILVDESQFLTEEQVEECRFIVDQFNIPVFLFGLKTDFRGHLFSGSKRILELADDIEEIKTLCRCNGCNRPAIINARVRDGKVVTRGEIVDIGGDDKYMAMCHYHWTQAQQDN